MTNATFTIAALAPDAQARATDTARAALDVVVARTLGEIEPLRAAWTELRARARLAPPNSDLDRFAAIVRALGPGTAPYLALFQREQRVCGGILGRVARQRSRHRLGYLVLPGPRLRWLDVVYGGLIGGEDEAVQRGIVTHLAALLRGGGIDLLRINHLPIDDPLLPLLSAELGRAGQLGADALHWRATLTPGDWAATQRGFPGKKYHQNASRKERKLRAAFEGALELRVHTGPDEVGGFLEVADRILRGTYQAALGAGFGDTPLWRAILASEAAAGRMRCYTLEARGEPIAYQAGAVHDGVYYGEATGYVAAHAALSPGAALHALVLADLCDAGVRAFDYGFGDADYKRAYAATSWSECAWRGRGRRWAAQLDGALEATVRGGERIMRRVAELVGGVGALKRAWRARLARRADATSAPSPPATKTTDDEVSAS